MIDRLTARRRSWLMSRVRGKNTTPEIRVRKCAHALGFRFRIHCDDLPGKPDVVFPKRKLALFVHGCYWHRHPGCRKATAPSSKFWAAKFAYNVKRDAQVTSALKALGWRVAIIWECETKDANQLPIILKRLIGRRKKALGKKTRRMRPPLSPAKIRVLR
jgi:DNA mismatch endonuclease (patch repair protein)